MNMNDISIIVPIYNELENLNSIILNLEKFKSKAEIIFVDGGSTDGSDKELGKFFRVINSDKKGRGNQMNYGVEHSSGRLILFLHGDSLLPEDGLEKILVKAKQDCKVGCFKLKFESRSTLMKICGFMSNNRVRFRNIAFGDQGIFIDREYFYSLGGYKDIPIMEDYQLSIDIKEDGEKIYLLNTKIITSERRFIKNGRIKTMAMMQKLQHMYRSGKDIEVIKNLYR